MVSNTNDSGPGSLRAAITEDDSDEPITFAPNLAGQVISLSSGPITITHNLTIQGLGANEVQVVSAGAVAPIPTDLWAGDGNTHDSSDSRAGVIPRARYRTAPGIVGQAFQLNGTNAVSVPDNLTLDSSSFTVGGWFNISQARLGTWPASTAGDLLQRLDPRDRRGSTHVRLESWRPRPPTAASHRPDALTFNTWYYIAATYDGNNVELYVDGTQVASGTLAGGYTPPAPLAHRSAGRAGTHGGYSIGSSDQFAFYNSALTANQITATYDATLALSQPAYRTTDTGSSTSPRR